jgi:hypothetical protein
MKTSKTKPIMYMTKHTKEKKTKTIKMKQTQKKKQDKRRNMSKK